MKHLIKTYFINIVVIIFRSIFSFVNFVNHKETSTIGTQKIQVPEVTTTKVKSKSWHHVVKTIGEANAIKIINITAQASNLVSLSSFKSGQIVKNNDIVFTPDTQKL